MKRESITETILKKQIKDIDSRVATLNVYIDRVQTQIDTLKEIRLNMLYEVTQLETTRKTASERRK